MEHSACSRWFPRSTAAPDQNVQSRGRTKSDFSVYRLLVVRSRVLWGDNVEISVDGDNISFESNELPLHEYPDTYLADGRDGKYIAGGVESYDASFSFPIVPTVADSASSTGNGAIGVAISGAVFFDPNAISDHYHGIPFWVTDAVDTDGEHATLIGYLFDGFGIYGPQDSDGSQPTDLDACMGHTGATPEFS